MGGGHGPDTFERIYVGNSLISEENSQSSVTVFNPNLPPASGEPPSVRFLKPVEQSSSNVAAYKGFVYSTNNRDDTTSIDIFKADGPNDQIEVAQLIADYPEPFFIFAYKDYIYVGFGFNRFQKALQVFEAYVPGSSSLTPVAQYTSDKEMSSLYVYNDYLYVAERELGLGDRLAVYNAYQGAGTDLNLQAQTTLDDPLSITAFDDCIYVVVEDSKIVVFDAYAGGGVLTQKTEVYEDTLNQISFIIAYKGYIYATFWNVVTPSIVRVFEAYKPGVQTTPLFQYSPLTDKAGVIIIPYDGKLYVPAVNFQFLAGKFVTLLDAYQGGGTNPDPIAEWENDLIAFGGAAYNGEHPEGNLYIDKSGSNVV